MTVTVTVHINIQIQAYIHSMHMHLYVRMYVNYQICTSWTPQFMTRIFTCSFHIKRAYMYVSSYASHTNIHTYAHDSWKTLNILCILYIYMYTTHKDTNLHMYNIFIDSSWHAYIHTHTWHSCIPTHMCRDMHSESDDQPFAHTHIRTCHQG